MKTISTISVLLIALSINVTAQVKIKERGGNSKPIPYQPRNEPKNDPAPSNNNQSTQHWGNGWNNGYPHGNVSFNFGYNPPNCQYNNYYGNGYSAKKAARNSIRSAGRMINQAVAFDNWHDVYSPLLAKSIRHYNYARELYWWGNYQAAFNHSERAGYLAWYGLQYFQDPGYGGYIEPNPYSDPYNPYYRTDQAANSQNSNGQGNKTAEVKMNGIDQKLPGSGTNDKELIRSFDKSELKDE